MDALVRAFTSEDDAVVLATDEGDVINDGAGDARNGDGDVDDEDGGTNDGKNDASDASEGVLEDAASDMFD